MGGAGNTRAHAHGRQAGGAAAEWVGAALVAALLVGALLASAGPNAVRLATTAGCAIERLTGDPEDCGDAPVAAPRAARPADDGRAAADEPIVVRDRRQRREAGTTIGGEPAASPATRGDPVVEAVAARAVGRPDPAVAPDVSYLRSNYWDADGCVPTDPDPGPACPPPAPDVALARATANQDPARIALSADPEIRRTQEQAVRAMQRAQDYHYRRFSHAGYDGAGSQALVGVTDLVDVGGQAWPGQGFVELSLATASSDYATTAAVHEFTHLVWGHFLPEVGYGDQSTPEGAQDTAANEAMAMLAEVETGGQEWLEDLSLPLEKPDPYEWTCPGSLQEGTGLAGGTTFRIDPRYENGKLIVAAFAEMARQMGTVTLGQQGESSTGGPPLATDRSGTEPAWQRLSQLRWHVLSTTLPPYGRDGHVGFGEIRAAFVEAARAVGFDPTIVGRAFDRQGIASADWTPPDCSASAAWANRGTVSSGF